MNNGLTEVNDKLKKLEKMLDEVVAENELLKKSIAENNPFEELYQYILQISFKEVKSMQITGNTRASNVCNQILQKMWDDYGVGRVNLF